MLLVIIGTVTCALINAYIKAGEAEKERAWKECEEIDWNEYYANKN